MRELERPTESGETQSEKTACKILTRVSTSNSTQKNIFITSEFVQEYGRKLLLYIAGEVGPISKEAADRIKAVVIE